MIIDDRLSIKKLIPSKEENDSIILTSILTTISFFIFSWREINFEIFGAIIYFFIGLIFIYMLYIIKLVSQKFIALPKGIELSFKHDQKISILSTILTFGLFGIVPICYPGHFSTNIKTKYKIGISSNTLENYKDLADVAKAGIIGISIYLVLVANLYLATNLKIFKYLILLTLFILVYNIIPSSKTDGLYIGWYSKMSYLFWALYIVVFTILIITTPETQVNFLTIPLAIIVVYIIQKAYEFYEDKNKK
jgi:hypothetical protein